MAGGMGWKHRTDKRGNRSNNKREREKKKKQAKTTLELRWQLSSWLLRSVVGRMVRITLTKVQVRIPREKQESDRRFSHI